MQYFKGQIHVTLCSTCLLNDFGQNLWRLFYYLAQFVSTTCERTLDYYHQKVDVRVAEQVQTWDLRKWGNFKKIS